MFLRSRNVDHAMEKNNKHTRWLAEVLCQNHTGIPKTGRGTRHHGGDHVTRYPRVGQPDQGVGDGGNLTYS